MSVPQGAIYYKWLSVKMKFYLLWSILFSLVDSCVQLLISCINWFRSIFGLCSGYTDGSWISPLESSCCVPRGWYLIVLPLILASNIGNSWIWLISCPAPTCWRLLAPAHISVLSRPRPSSIRSPRQVVSRNKQVNSLYFAVGLMMVL